ncbi:MAG: proton extrusion protein PcxA [Cyanophyceae cyanobacterium]
MSSPRSSPFSTVRSLWAAAGRWYETTPDRALNRAYDAALAIAAIETRYFDGNVIDPDSPQYTGAIRDYFRSELKKHFTAIDLGLAEFRTSNLLFRRSRLPDRAPPVDPREDAPAIEPLPTVVDDRPDGPTPRTQGSAGNDFLILKKLETIDRVRGRYESLSLAEVALGSGGATVEADLTDGRPGYGGAEDRRDRPNFDPKTGPKPNFNGDNSAGSGDRSGGLAPRFSSRHGLQRRQRGDLANRSSLTNRTSVLPRSLLSTLDRVRRDLDDRSEEEVVKKHRSTKIRTIVSLRFLLLLILVPLLTQQVAKNFLVGPIVDHSYHPPLENIFLNLDMQEEALVELEHYEHLLRFRNRAHHGPHLTDEEIEERLDEKALEIAETAQGQSADAIKNIISDFISLLGFGIVIASSREEIAILKSFIDEIVYGLSDSAKAFVIILSTDIFVGYHSTHGWEVVVSGISRHFGLPENRDFMFLFIATFPVILDAVIKYWIFRYLNRISPSAVATYKDMNE